MVHTPGEASVTVAADTVQTAGVVEAKLTARPDDAVAPIPNGVAPKVWPASAPKLMVCCPGVT
jgi:hypothetical protein